MLDTYKLLRMINQQIKFPVDVDVELTPDRSSLKFRISTTFLNGKRYGIIKYIFEDDLRNYAPEFHINKIINECNTEFTQAAKENK